MDIQQLEALCEEIVGLIPENAPPHLQALGIAALGALGAVSVELKAAPRGNAPASAWVVTFSIPAEALEQAIEARKSMN